MKKEEIYFVEKQRLSYWLLIGVIILAFAIRLIKLIMHNKAITFDRFDDILISVAIIFSIYLICVMKTFINEDGIYVKFLPFMWKYKFISWENVENANIKKYRPILESGGWGMRFDLFSKAKKTYYTTRGNIGLQLELKNGKNVLIGTQQPQEIEEVLKKLNIGKFAE